MSDREVPGLSGGRAFRDDIQGMRALAVALVILAHAGFGTVAGGFIGVDVFFVVSGYLIIGLLLREAQEQGRISVLGFYARRARRILPAASLVLMVTVVFAVSQWSFERATEVIKDALWAACFGANIRFTSVETDYFATGDPPSPVQHFWSLAVEEQFYLVIPFVMLLVALAVVGRRVGMTSDVRRERVRRAAILVLGVLSLGSFLWCLQLTAADPTVAYFATPTRAWELGVGGLAAMVVTPRGRDLLRGWHAELLGWIGLGLVLWAAVSYDATTEFPGAAAAVPVVGTAMMLVAGATKAGETTLLTRLLSLRLLTLLGAWSYSLYLWHWPVLQAGETHWGRPLAHAELAVVLVATVALSAATYYAVEEPFRRGRVWRPPWRAVVLYPASLALVFASGWAGQSWIDHELHALADNPALDVADFADAGLSGDPAEALVQASLLAAKDGHPVPGRLAPALGTVRASVADVGDCDYPTGTRELCPTGDPEATRTIVLTGDSHARAWGPTWTAIGAEHGFVVYHLPYSGCPANDATRPDPASGRRWTACEEFKEWVHEQIATLRPDYVVVANRNYKQAELSSDQFEGLAETLEAFAEHAGHVVMIGNVPVLPKAPGSCLTVRGVTLNDCVMQAAARPRREQRRFAVTAKSAGAEFLDVGRWFCVKRTCPPVIGEFVPLRDREHVTVEYAEALAAPMAAVLGIPRL